MLRVSKVKFPILLSIFVLILLTGCTISKVSVADPVSLTERVNFLDGEEIEIVYFDNRSKKLFSNEIQQSITQDLTRIYPSASFIQLDESDYFRDPVPDRITLKINIASYKADLKIGLNTWKAEIEFNVTLYDNREENEKFTTEINTDNSKLNFFGFNTPEKTTQRSYKSAMYELTRFLDSSLMK